MSKIFRNTSIYTIGNILPTAINFLLLPIITRYLTPADYGIVASMSVIGAILNIIYTMCLQRSVPRLFFDYKDEKEQKDFLGTVFISIITIALVILSAMFIFSGPIGRIYKDIPFYPYYVYIIISTFLNAAFFSIPRIYFQIKERAKDFVVLTIGPFIVQVLLILWFVVALKQGAEGQLKAGLIAAVIFFPIFFVLNLKIINFKFSFSVLRQTLVFSIPFIPTMLFSWVLNWTDRIFIERYFDLSNVGIYSLGYRLGMISLIIAQGFSFAYAPIFYRLANYEEVQEAKNKLEKYNNFYILASLALCFFIALFAKEIVLFLMDFRYIEAYKITRIIVFASFFSGLQGIVSLSIMQSKKTKQNMYIGIGNAVLNITLNFILVPRLGMYGAALSTIITFASGYLVMYQYSKRCFFIPIEWGKIVTYVIFMVMVVLIYNFVIEKNIYVSLISKFILLSIGGLILFPKIRELMNKFSSAST